MALISLTLTGFNGVRDGMHRESIHLDFRALGGSPKLVAITGGNGRGKTTVLNNMIYYPVMPSQAGRDGLGAFSYYDEVYLPENHKVLVWEQNGTVFRQHLVIRLAGRRRTEAYLHIRHGSQWKPVRLPDGTVSDGKMDTYTRCIEHVAGSQTVFLTTCFSAQNRRSLSKYDNAEIKALFGDLLGLSEIRHLGTSAAETAKLLRTGLQPLRHQCQLRREEEAALTGECAALLDVSRREDWLRHSAGQAKMHLARAHSEHAALVAQASYDQQFQARRHELKADRDQIVARHRAAMEDYAQRQRAHASAYETIKRGIRQRKADRQRSRTALLQQQTILDELLNRRTLVLRAESALPRWQALVAARKELLAEHRTKAQRAATLDDTALHLQHRIAAIEHSAGKAVLRVNDLKRRCKLTEQVPCAGTDLPGRCTLLADARTAKPLIPSALEEVARLGTDRQDLEDQLADLRRQRDALGDPHTALARHADRLQRTEQRFRDTCALAARRRDVDAAETNRAIVVAQLSDLTAQSVREAAEDRTRLQELNNEAAALQRDRDNECKLLKQADERIQHALAALPAPFDQNRLAAAERQLSDAQEALNACEQTLQDAAVKAQLHADAGKRLGAIRLALLESENLAQRVEASCATWTTLAKALGNDGIIALSIEDAGPELTVLTNNLLMACYGPRFTVSLQTLVATAKGEMTDGFAIVVHDAESQQSKNLAKMSGGERVWINESLFRAMALFLARRSRTRSDTLFSDEADGAFDPEHKRMFMAMKRAVLDIGDYNQEFFISHTPELIEMADAVIDLDQYVLSISDESRVEHNPLATIDELVY
ncbi:DNA repair protein [Pseudoduganella buxea]|uniref:DNA repair protein n=1 Tax=Pseudoduganella buxea TaxID=1949069 RepID=A0A6I3SWD3_9BURK|nr:DNA repair protein [Pseudoduganella buxea]MTV53540.1 DNA repair protein [Pseudoduganella buxea]GGC22966.1 hypothetical protein GCM10011572_50570 [Pseudoduganella buxea]